MGKSITDNLLYVCEFALIIAAVFLVAYAVEKFAKKRNGDTERVLSTRKIAVIGVFSAIATVLHVFDFSVPFAPPFYKLDFSEIPVLVCGFAFGPVAGVMTEMIKILLKLVVKGTSTAFVGDLANFVVGCSFVLPASVLYHFVKTRTGAILSCIAGTVTITVCGTLLNAVYLLPAFSALYGIPMDALIGMGSAVNARIVDVPTFVLLAVAPMNLLKGASVSLITMLVYKKLSPVIKYGSATRKTPAMARAAVK
ncbi:MAG: ECF transporter S component [Lachnospiraceae bacterium]|nr:ECF transporter S component [Lachnospiraceae bacterium]